MTKRDRRAASNDSLNNERGGAAQVVSLIVQYKQPRSVQVVIFCETHGERRYLLLKRVTAQGGFWQTVTGSLEEGESHRQAAVREVVEETGVVSREDDLIDLGLVNTFEIAPQWRNKYRPGVTHNEEICFALKIDECELKLDSREHEADAWEAFERALEMLYWDSSKRALTAARRLEPGLVSSSPGRKK